MTKSIYLAGGEVHLNGDQQCENFIATQITNKETVESVFSGIELVFKEGRLAQAYDYEEGQRKERSLATDEIGLPYREYEENRILKVVEDENGPHQIGGEVPQNFRPPENNCMVPFQYLGFIDHSDQNFAWLPFRLHLTFPIYLNTGNVFLDYANPDFPSIVNREEVEAADTAYDDLNKESEIVFNAMKFSFAEAVEFAGIGHGGVPNWIQYPGIPVCPKSGRRMRFLCQLNGGVSTNRSNVEAKDEWYAQYYEELNFWGDGDLFVFFEPTSRIACYFIQNT